MESALSSQVGVVYLKVKLNRTCPVHAVHQCEHCRTLSSLLSMSNTQDRTVSKTDDSTVVGTLPSCGTRPDTQAPSPPAGT